MSSTLRRARRRGERPMIYGRDRERAQLRELLDDAIAGHGSLVLISGEAGIGKTTLVDGLIHEAEQRDCLVLTGGCYDLTTTPPYGPWREVLGAYEPGDDSPETPSWFGNPEELERVGSQARLFDETRAFFASVAERQSLVIVLEDLHWSDAASLDALRYLARQLAGTPVLLVATYRDDEVTRRHQLSRMLPAIVRESTAARLNLAPLDEAAVRDLITDRYPLSPEDLERLSDHIADLAEGNSLYVVELLQTLEDVGSLKVDEDRAEVGALDRVVVPPLIGQLIETRLERLDPDAANLLETAAIIGQEFDYELWLAVSNSNDDLLFNTLETALRRHLIQETDRSGRYRFTHALIREALYERQIWPRRRQQHRRVAEALEEQPQPDPDAVAYHFQTAEDDRAANWLIASGELARQAYAWLAAVQRYEVAAGILASDRDSQPVRAKLLTDIAGMLTFQDPRRGIRFAEEALLIARRIEDPRLIATALMQCGALKSDVDRIKDALADMREAALILDSIEDESLVTHAGRSVRSTLWLQLSDSGHFVEAMNLKNQDRSNDRSWLRDREHVLGRTYAMLGQPEEARRIFCDQLSLAKESADIIGVATAVSSELFFLTIPYFFDDTQYKRDIAESYRSSLAGGDGFVRDSARVAVPPDHSTYYLDARDWASWRTWLDGLVLFGNSFWAHNKRSALGSLARNQGDVSTALDEIGVALPGGIPTEPGSTPSFYASTVLQRLAAEIALDNQEPGEARSWLEAYDHWMEWSGAVLGLAEGQLGWARYYRVAGDPDKAREHAERGYQHASDPRQPLALIAADRFLGQIDVDEGKWDEAEGHLDASLALAERCEAPFEQALTLVVMAERAAKLGEGDEARKLIKRVREICEPLGAKPTLERVDEIEATLPRTRRSGEEHPFGLTGREIEVLRLVARGRTDAEAAEELFISPRTVSQHLRNAYNKIGVNNRAEATRVAVEAGIV